MKAIIFCVTVLVSRVVVQCQPTGTNNYYDDSTLGYRSGFYPSNKFSDPNFIKDFVNNYGNGFGNDYGNGNENGNSNGSDNGNGNGNSNGNGNGNNNDGAAARAVRALHALEADRASDALTLLREWLAAQPHLAHADFSDQYLENALISCKGSVERTKSKLDKYCTIRSMMPDVFETIDTKTYESQFFNLIVCPHLTKQYYRVVVAKLFDKPLTDTGMDKYLKYAVNIIEYLKSNDYFDGVVLILDYMDDNSMKNMLFKMTPADVTKAHTVVDGYGIRIKAIHILTKSKVVETLVSILKQVLTKKLSGRIHLHSSFDTLHEFVDKEVLPLNYGGEQKSIDELNDAWIKELTSEKHVAHMLRMAQARSLEELRPAAHFNTHYMGMPGSFRTLNVD